MKKGEYIDALLRSPKTVFSTKDIAILWKTPSAHTRARLHYAVTNNQLIHLRRGLYAKDKNYNPYELAIKLNTPAYISFETVLTKAGVIFQYYEDIFVASYASRTILCKPHQFVLRRMNESILTNPLGIELDKEYAIASTERALLDTLYLNKGYHFDNLNGIDWDKVFELLSVYNNRRLHREARTLYEKSKER